MKTKKSIELHLDPVSLNKIKRMQQSISEPTTYGKIISGFDFDGIDDQEGLFDMVNHEFTITEQLCPKEVSTPSLT